MGRPEVGELGEQIAVGPYFILRDLRIRTLVPADGAGGGWVQADRGALPAQTPFLAGEQNAAYLAGEPVDDARFVAVFAHGLEHAGGYTQE